MSSDHARTTASISQGSTGELNGGPSFKLDIGIGGKIVPHASIRVRGVVSALRTTPLVHVDLMVFEAQAPQQSGWKQNLGVPVFAKPMSEAHLNSTAQRGGTLNIISNIVIPKPGLYRVVLSARTPNAPENKQGIAISNTVYRELSLQVDSAQGRVLR